MLVWRQEEHLARKSTGMVTSLERGVNDLVMVQLMPLPPHYLLLQLYAEWFITDCINLVGNAIASVRPSVCPSVRLFPSIFETH